MPRRQFSAEYITAAAHLLGVLSHEVRLNLVLLLVQGEATVTELCDLLAIPQSNVSHHLSILRAAGLVTDRREGQFVVYAVNVPMWTAMGNGFFDYLADGENTVRLQHFLIERGRSGPASGSRPDRPDSPRRTGRADRPAPVPRRPRGPTA